MLLDDGFAGLRADPVELGAPGAFFADVVIGVRPGTGADALLAGDLGNGGVGTHHLDEDHRHSGGAGIVDQTGEAGDHRLGGGEVAAVFGERTIRVAEVVLDIDDDDGGMLRIDFLFKCTQHGNLLVQ